MFSVGEKVVYGQSGVCLIEDICEKEIIRNQKRKYYVLKPILEQNNTIYAPMEENKVFMRHIITKAQAEELIEKLPEIIEEPLIYNVDSKEYDKKFVNYECSDLAQLASQIYKKKIFARSQNKKIGFIDEKYMHRAETLLFGELAVALGIPFDDVKKYIEQKIK